MAKKTQGTQIYIVDPDDNSLISVACPASISGVSATRDQIESTCLDSTGRTYEAGFLAPGQVNFELYFDPAQASHERIHELWKSGDKFELAIGWSDGTAAPTVGTDGLFDIPTTRSFVVLHDCFFVDVPLDFQLNALVKSTVSVQFSGQPDLFKKT